MRKKFSLFNICNYTLLFLFGLLALYPFAYILNISLMPEDVYLKHEVVLIPQRISFAAYIEILKNGSIFASYRSTIIITLGGTFASLALTILCAYALSKTKLKGYKIFINMIIFTMYFQGGLIPSYLLLSNLGLVDKYMGVILYSTISTYNVLVLRSFFINIPESLEEAAIIDGASEVYVLWKIILPISLPAIATIALFYSVGYWNSYFIPMILLSKREMWPLQVVLREILFESTESMRTTGESGILQASPIGPQLKMAVVIITIVPIVMVYPFLQKYFVKGVLIGAVKG